MSTQYIEKLDDFYGTIAELKEILAQVESRYGHQSTIYFDAGPNNVQVVVETTASDCA